MACCFAPPKRFCSSNKIKEFPDDELDSDDLRPLLASLKFFKAKYTHKTTAAGFCYEALRALACHSISYSHYSQFTRRIEWFFFFIISSNPKSWWRRSRTGNCRKAGSEFIGVCWSFQYCSGWERKVPWKEDPVAAESEPGCIRIQQAGVRQKMEGRRKSQKADLQLDSVPWWCVGSAGGALRPAQTREFRLRGSCVVLQLPMIWLKIIIIVYHRHLWFSVSLNRSMSHCQGSRNQKDNETWSRKIWKDSFAAPLTSVLQFSFNGLLIALSSLIEFFEINSR